MSLSQMLSEVDSDLFTAFESLGETHTARYFPKDGSAPYEVRILADKTDLSKVFEHSEKADVVDEFTLLWSEIKSNHINGHNDTVKDEIVLNSQVWQVLLCLAFDGSIIRLKVKPK